MKKNFRIFSWRKSQKKLAGVILPKNYRKMPKWKVGLYYLFYFFIAIIFFTAVAFAWYAKDLPTPSKIANMHPAESTKIYDRTGQILLYETGNQKRTIVTNDQLSPYLKDATISTEDAKFYSHHGFDTKAIFRAVYDKATGKTSRVSGTSTITQQYVKNALLSSDRSFSRKFKELILSIELEFMYSKDEILTMYLNEIPYGNSTAGAEAASRMYYGKAAKDLTLAQAATLAAIPQSPTYYSPYGTHTDKLIVRRNYVLDRMVETGKITKEDASKAKLEDTTTLNVSLKPRHDSILAPHFAMYVLEQVADQYGEEKIQKDGLKIITTLDYNKQKLAEQTVQDNRKMINSANGSNAALVSVDPKTGQILDMVGSVDYFDASVDGNVNVTDSLRQPGSSFKVFEYSTLLKQKDYSPSKIFYDFQTDFGNNYVPKNFSGKFNGPVTMRSALDNSLNIPAIKATALAGIDNVIRTASDLGITSLTDRNRYGVSLGIGVAEVRPVEMANAYGTLANGGDHQDLTSVLKITDSGGKVLYDFDRDHKHKQVLDPQIAYEMSNMLSDNNSRVQTFGQHSALYFADRTVAAKTGTTQDNRDGWTCGYTPSLVTVVWVGNNMPSPMRKDAVELAGPIFHQFMEKALANTPNEEFKVPDGVQTVTVEKYSNKLPNEFSKETTTDIFASWQVPTTPDDVHVSVRVCKSNGKLAPDNLSDSLVEVKTFSSIHSERPDNPKWENPVRAWAEANGLADRPPTSYCTATEVAPEISITSPSNYANLSGESQISASSSSHSSIKFVEFFIDDISIGQVSAPSGNTYATTYNFSNLSLGTHKISAVANDINGGTATSSITITVNGSQNTLSISGIVASPITSNSATIGWSTSIPSTSQVSYGLSQSNLTDLASQAGMSSVHSVQLTGLSPNTTYYYKVTSVDGANNSVSSELSSFTTNSSQTTPQQHQN